jgi:3-oxoacyl-[acyl-carrier protein] reductase
MPRVALVTGAAGSIGRATCEALLEDGFAVLAADLAEPSDEREGMTWQRLDVTDVESLNAAFDVAAGLGDLTAVVNSHGILRHTKPEEPAGEAMRQIIAVNLEGVANVLQAASTRLGEGDSIVSLSSIVARIGRAKGAFVYAATKAGLESLTRSFAVALGPQGVRVNAVAPGFVSEPMAGEGSDMREVQGGDDPLIAATPMARLVTPAEIAEGIRFLCSDRASGISGVVLPVDNAQSAV